MATLATSHGFKAGSGRRLGVLLGLSIALHLVLIAMWQGTPNIALQTGPVVTVRLNAPEPHAEPPIDAAAQAAPAAQHDIAPTPRARSAPATQTAAAAAEPRPAQAPAESSKVRPEPTTARPPAQPAPEPETTQSHAKAAGASWETAKAKVLARVRDDIARHFSYPPMARKLGWEGEVLLGIHILANGDIERVVIAQSSGHAVLDHSALETLQRIGQVGGAAAWLQGHSLELTLPVIYRLTSS